MRTPTPKHLAPSVLALAACLACPTTQARPQGPLYSCIGRSWVPMTQAEAMARNWQCEVGSARPENAETPDFPEPRPPLVVGRLCLAYVGAEVNAIYATGPRTIDCGVSCEGPRAACVRRATRTR